MDDEEAGLRKRRQAEYEQMAEAKKAQEQLKGALRNALEESAYNRIMNIAVANKELYLVAAKQVLMIVKRAGRKLTEEELVTLLRAIQEQTSTETSITFHKK
ncbi:MAG: DNA-binding protein [Candidatus Micrarchaeota archaeon]